MSAKVMKLKELKKNNKKPLDWVVSNVHGPRALDVGEIKAP